MEIFVKCPCGSRYSFNEEPVNGRLRFPVKCTNCGIDGTALANEYIRKSLSGELAEEKRRARVWWRRLLNRKEEDSCRPMREGPSTERAPNLALGAAGAAVGGFIGMCGWYWLTKTTGWEIGYVAWAVGLIVGFGARRLAPGGGFNMASIAAVCALAAILGGQYLVLRNFIEEMVDTSVTYAYEDSMKLAKLAVAADTNEKVEHLLAEYGTPARDDKGKNPSRVQQRYMSQIGWMFPSSRRRGRCRPPESPSRTRMSGTFLKRTSTIFERRNCLNYGTCSMGNRRGPSSKTPCAN